MDKSDFNTPRNTAASVKPSRTNAWFLTVLFVCLLGNTFVAKAATITSTSTGGNWSNPSTWVGGVVPTGIDVAVISSTATVTISSNISVKTITISGVLIVSGDITVTTLTALVVNGILKFESNQSSLTLPLGATIDINAPGKIDDSGGSCSNNVAIFVGPVKFAVCAGGGNAVYTFQQINTVGGTLQSLPSSNAPICFGNALIFSANKDGANGDKLMYSWSIIDPNNLQTNTVASEYNSLQPPPTYTILNPISGTYKATLTYTTTYDTTTYTSTKAIDALVNALPTVNAISGGSTAVCVNSTTPAFTDTTPSGTWSITNGIGSASVTTGGVVTGLTAGTVTVNYSVTTSGCTTNTTKALTVNPAPAAPTTTTTQPSCSIATGTITITAIPGETYSFNNNSSYSSTDKYEGLIQGSLHTVRAQNASGCISAPASSTINSLVTKIWNGAPSPPWFKDGFPTLDAPTINNMVVIDYDYNTSTHGDLNACSLTINSGSKLEITSGNTVTIQNDLTVNANATLKVLNKGSLLMVNDAGIVTNTGTTYIHRSTNPFKKYDYVYWSSPVTSTSIANTFQSIGWNTNRAYEYIPGSDWSFASTMSPGKGYIIMVPTPTGSPGSDDVSTVIFSGKVNNGDKIKIPVNIDNSSYLIGNPYPSAIDADKFLDANSGVLNGTLYFWTHNTALRDRNGLSNAGSGAYAYTSNDYAVYNRTGGVGTDGTGTQANSSGSNTSIPTGYIASGQGFFVSSQSVGEIVFKNAMRLAGTTSPDNKTGVNEQFFKTSNTKSKTASVLQKHRIWLDLKNSQGAFKQMLVGYISGATNDYESRFDGESYDGNQFVDFYSLNQNKNLTIQGRAVPFDENDTVPLGFKTTIDGSFTINIGQVDGALTNQAVYLEDKLTNTIFDLKTGSYSFSTAKGTFNERFVLRYTNDKTLGVGDMDNEDGILVFYSNNYKTLIIKNNVMDATVNSVALFNTTGQRIANFDVKDSSQTNLQIPIKNIASGIYIVKVKTTKGESSKKVIVN